MYYCKRCNVRVNGTNETCPLCKAPMEGVAEPFPPYPEKKATRSKNRPITFTGVYVSLAILVLIICFALNFEACLSVFNKYHCGAAKPVIVARH